jgi:hypothetical protein
MPCDFVSHTLAGRRATAAVSSCAVSLPVCALYIDPAFCIRVQLVAGELDAGGLLSMGIATRDAAGWSGGFVKGFGMHRRSVSTAALALCAPRDLTARFSGGYAAAERPSPRPQPSSSAQRELAARTQRTILWRETRWS